MTKDAAFFQGTVQWAAVKILVFGQAVGDRNFARKITCNWSSLIPNRCHLVILPKGQIARNVLRSGPGPSKNVALEGQQNLGILYIHSIV